MASRARAARAVSLFTYEEGGVDCRIGWGGSRSDPLRIALLQARSSGSVSKGCRRDRLARARERRMPCAASPASARGGVSFSAGVALDVLRFELNSGSFRGVLLGAVRRNAPRDCFTGSRRGLVCGWSVAHKFCVCLRLECS